jgi:hypothetical protein
MEWFILTPNIDHSIFKMQIVNDNLLQLVLTSRLIDVGAILVSVTAVIVTTKTAVKKLTEDVNRLSIIIEDLCKQGLHREIEIERIKARCVFLNRGRGEGCTE